MFYIGFCDDGFDPNFAVYIDDVIRKTGKGYEVRSHKGKRLGGPYKSKKEAERRLRQVEHYKREGK